MANYRDKIISHSSGIYVVLQTIGSVLFLPLWYLQKLMPRRKNLWIFGAGFGGMYYDNSKHLFEYVLEHEPDITPVWMTSDTKVYDMLQREGKPVVMMYSLKGIMYTLKADTVFFSHGSSDVNRLFVNGAKLMNLWHGVPLKVIGFDERRFENAGWFKRFKTKIRHIIMPYAYDGDKFYIISSSDVFIPVFKSAFGMKYDRVLVTGIPRNDAIGAVMKHRLAKQIDERFGEGTLKIMYMPTFRDNGVFSPFTEFGFDAEALSGCLKRNNAVFMYKWHAYDDVTDGRISDRIIQVTEGNCPDVYRLLNDVDILVTDYSSIYFDFLLLKRPVILTPFDLDDYMRSSRKFYFEYDSLDAVQAEDWNAFIRVLDEKRYYVPSDNEVRRFHKHVDFNSAERVVDAVMNL